MSEIREIFEAIVSIRGDNPDEPQYAVMPIPRHGSYLIGKDNGSHACLLVSTVDHAEKREAPIRLESIDVQFELGCKVRKDQRPEYEDTFTIVRCRSLEKETIRYFLSVCDTIVRFVGDSPTQRSIASVVNRLAAIFQKMRNPPTRPVNGLFGELFLIWRSFDPIRALEAWRVDLTASFDFTDGDIRIDVKTTGGGIRAHTFSYEQCNPPEGSIAVVASLFVEHSPGGVTLLDIIEDIGRKTAGNIDLTFKLHDVVASTLGVGMNNALMTSFDERLADSSLRFFSLKDVPAIRGALPAGVSDVHFRSDMSFIQPLTAIFQDNSPTPFPG